MHVYCIIIHANKPILVASHTKLQRYREYICIDVMIDSKDCMCMCIIIPANSPITIVSRTKLQNLP